MTHPPSTPKRKRFAFVLIALALGGGFGACSHVRTAPFTGVVKNTSTGEPIAQVFVSCTWRGNELGLERTGKLFAQKVAVTDEAGRYEIPEVTFFVMDAFDGFFERFHSGGCSFGHPLYKRTGFSWGWAKSTMPDGNPWPGSYQYLYQKRARDGVIRYDIELKPIEEVFVEKEDANDFGSFLSGWSPKRWPDMKRYLGVRYDVDEILAVWSRINARVYRPDLELRTLRKKRQEIEEIVKEGY